MGTSTGIDISPKLILGLLVVVVGTFVSYYINIALFMQKIFMLNIAYLAIVAAVAIIP